ncbi:MAG: CoA pyrophosphatase [Myxococcales bacterium]|nr:CoA pyrophosphatase [Myxococcales bacterium]MCB9752400.1 CoA pyrophosphatase [Myxococcales bacterium]
MLDAITPGAVEEALRGHETADFPALPGRRNHLRAAVLVPVIWDPAPLTILTIRAADLRLHAGEVVFPGGRFDPADDASLADTALREAREEVGLGGARIIGTLSSIPLYTSEYRLEPYVALAPAQRLVAQESEVAAILPVAIGELLARASIDGIAWTRPDGSETLSPVFDLDGRLAYGGTAHVLYELLEVLAPLAGRRPPPMRVGRFTWQDVLGPRAPKGI